MKVMKTVQIKYDVIEKELCDICGEETNEEDDEIILNAKIGNYYSEDDRRETYEIDLCRGCFRKVRSVIEQTFSIKFKRN